jgi:alkylhydroperoxidase family enzyme
MLQGIYNKLEDGIRQKAERVEIDKDWMIANTDFETVENELLYIVVRSLVCDHPEYFWFDGSYGISVTEVNGVISKTEIVLVYDTTYGIYCCDECAFLEPEAETCACTDCIFNVTNPDKMDPEQTAFLAAAEALLAECPDGSDYEKAAAIAAACLTLLRVNSIHFAPFLPLHLLQRTCKLEDTLFPPFEIGTMWSM